MPRIKHVHLKFEGDEALEYLELRKLGLFSKKAFKDAKSLTLEYIGKQTLRDGHIKTLANHMNRGLRKLKHFSIKFEMEREWRWARWQSANIIPLFNSMKQSFVSLVTLKLSLGENFQFSILECKGFDRLFAKVRSTLRHLDLDFSGNESKDITDPLETLEMVIMNRLHKLETLCLDFNRTKTSTRIVRLLMSGACTHLTRLRSLDVSVEGCNIVQEGWNSYPVHNLKSSLQDLRLNFGGCSGLSLYFLTMLQNDILTFYPKLQRLFVSTLNCLRYSNGFYSSLEEKFLQGLDLKWFRLLYSEDIEKNLERYQEMQLLETRQTLVMQKKVEKIQKRARGEEEVGLYLKTLREEEQASEGHKFDEREYLYNNSENEFLVKEETELEDQNRLNNIIENFGGAIEDAQEYLYDYLSSDSDPYGSYEDLCYMQYEVYTLIQKEQDFQDRMETEIRFRGLTKGGKVTQIYLNYGDSLDV